MKMENPGMEHAEDAARAADAYVATPDPAMGGGDFNDQMREKGPDSVLERVLARFRPAPLPEAQSTRENGSGAVVVGEWPDPKPIQAELKPVLAFDADVLLPEPIRSWVMDEADRMPCAPEYVAVPALVSIGSIVSTQCAIKPKGRDDWVVVPNLWGGAVGGPSSLKTPGQEAALKPLNRLVNKAIAEHESQAMGYETKQLIRQAQQEAIESQLKAAAKDSSKGDVNQLASELLAFKQQVDEPPILRRYKTNDSTVEKLGEILRDAKRGILVSRDELVGLLSSWDREGREGDRAFFLEAFNGTGSFDTDRISRGSIFIDYLCVSIYGGIQPDKLIGYLEQAAHSLGNDGMLQRFQMLVFPDAREWEWRDRLPAREARDEAFKVFEKLADLRPEDWGAMPKDDFVRFPHFRFTEEAQALFIRWMGELHERIALEDSPIIQQHLAKYPRLYPALALIFHLIDCAANDKRGQVSAEAGLMAAAWCQFLEGHARRCYGLLADDGMRAAQMLSEKIRQGKLSDGFTARDVRRHQWRYLKTDEAIHAALEWLADDDWIRATESGGTGPGSGRRTLRFQINPKAVDARPNPLGGGEP